MGELTKFIKTKILPFSHIFSGETAGSLQNSLCSFVVGNCLFVLSRTRLGVRGAFAHNAMQFVQVTIGNFFERIVL